MTVAIGGLQLRRVLDVDVDEAEVIVAEDALAYGGADGGGPGSAVQPLGPQSLTERELGDFSEL